MLSPRSGHLDCHSDVPTNYFFHKITIMISIVCLQKPRNLPNCYNCPALSYCGELTEKVIPLLAKRLGIDRETGRVTEHNFCAFDEETRHGLFLDVLEAIEKNISSFQDRSKLSTWAFGIYKNKINDEYSKKYRNDELFEDQPSTSTYTQDPDWEEWVSNNIQDQNHLYRQEIILEKNDMTTAILECFSRIMMNNKNCGVFLVRVYERAVQLVREDTYYEHKASCSINFNKVLETFVHANDSIEAIKQRYHRCKKLLDPLLQQCLDEMGYGDY